MNYVAKHKKDNVLHTKSGTIDIQNYNENNMHTQVYADLIYPRKYIENALRTEILPQFYYDNVNFSNVHQHNIKLSYAIKKMFDSIENVEKNNILNNSMKFIGVDNVDKLSLSFDIKNSDMQIHKYYIPAYSYIFTKNSYQSYHFINGYNGKYSGSHVNNLNNYLYVSILGFLPLYLITDLAHISPMYSLFSLATLNFIVNATNKCNILCESSDDEGKKRDEFHENYIFSDDNLYSLFETKSNNKIFELYPEECNILEITNNDVATKEFLKNQKTKLLKMYHPDVYGKNGSDMTIKIMNAYSKLLEAI